MKKLLSLIMTILITLSFASCNNKVDYNGYIHVTHIIDSETGMPYTLYFDEATQRYANKSDSVISATIISDESARADAYATAVCIMGLDKGIEFLQRQNLRGIIFTLDKKMAIVGDIAIEKSKFDEYKDYQLYYGEYNYNGTGIIEADYGKEYAQYNGNIFADTMSYNLTLMGENTEKVKDLIVEQWREIEDGVSLNKSDSELSKLNALGANEEMQISKITYDILSEAKSVNKETSGAFNPAVVGLSKMWGVDIEGINKYRPYSGSSPSSWRQPEKLPTLSEIQQEKANCDMTALELYEKEGSYYALKHNENLKMDLGGIAKGYAVDMARRTCEENDIKSAIIDIAGNLYLLNSKVTDSVMPWTVNVVSPTERNPFVREMIMKISVPGDVTIVTSGDYQRYYFYGYEE